MKSKLDVLLELQHETNRFLEKLKTAIADQRVLEKENAWPSTPSKPWAAAKRSALDLKNELTNLTQYNRG